MMPALSEPRSSPSSGQRTAAANRDRATVFSVTETFALRNRSLTLVARRDDHGSETGVQLPLLAPMLAGLRLRAGAAGSEFILPNPSGGRGVYVTSWPVVTGFATPSPHDTLLIGRLAGLQRIDPHVVRDAARWIAREGHAGPAAADAARDVDESLRVAAFRLGGQLLMALARRGGFTRPEEAARCLSRGGFSHLAGRLGWHGPDLAEALRLVSSRYATVATGTLSYGGGVSDGWGGATRSGAGRWGRLTTLLRRLRAALAEEQSNGHGTDGTMIGRIIGAADQSLATVDRLLPEIDTMHMNPLPLLEACRDGEAQGAGWLAGLETALDGWARVCLLWFDPDTPSHRQAVIAEMAVLTGTVGSGETRLQSGLPGDPATHARLLARNERLRACELLLDVGAA